jgi:hypothetical protein
MRFCPLVAGCITNPTLQLGVFLDDLVRVELHHGEAAVPVVNLGEQTDVRPRIYMSQNANMCNTQIYSAIRLVTLVNVFVDIIRAQILIDPLDCQVFFFLVSIVLGCTFADPRLANMIGLAQFRISEHD